MRSLEDKNIKLGMEDGRGMKDEGWLDGWMNRMEDKDIKTGMGG
jgi:hypothetical protein